LLKIGAVEVNALDGKTTSRATQILGQRRQSSGDFFLLLHAGATWRTALGIAQSADVNAQLPKSANEGAPVHSQSSGGFALIPIDIPEDDKDKLLLKFSQRFGIEDARPVHPEYQCLKLAFRGIRMFSTHVQPAEAFASAP